MKQIVFHNNAFEDFIEWSREDKKLFSRIVRLIKEIQRQPFGGIGKPEPLKHDYIASCKYHYG